MQRVPTPISLLLALAAAAPSAAGQCFTQQLTASDAEALDAFGWGMDLDTDLLAIGSIGDDEACPGLSNCNSGSVYLWRRVGGVWTPDGKVTHSDGVQNDEFGHDISISGSRILVGAHKKATGAAYTFVHNGTSWVQEQKLVGSGLQNNFHFGHSVSLEGDIALVGTMRDDHQGFETGSAFVFTRIGGVWVEAAKLVASDAAAEDRFGRACDMEGGYIALSAHLHDGVASDTGAVYVYEHDDNGTAGDLSDDTWPEVTDLTASDATAGMLFGRSVDFAGDILIVGAEFGLSGGVDTGAAYVFIRTPGGNWVEVQKLVPSDGVSGDRFGISVSIEGNYALVGARSANGTGGSSGAVYVYTRTPTGFFETGKLLGPDTAGGDQLGHETGVHVIGNTALISARFNDAAADNGGSAYVFQMDDCLGTTYCDISPNSAGPGAEIRGAGLPSISDNGFSVISTGAIPNKVGLFFYGPNQINVPLGDGRLCVGGVSRLNPPQLSDGTGTATRHVDFTVFPAGSGPNQITAGSTWNFQHWFRDTDAAMSGFNLSNAVEVEFIP